MFIGPAESTERHTGFYHSKISQKTDHGDGVHPLFHFASLYCWKSLVALKDARYHDMHTSLKIQLPSLHNINIILLNLCVMVSPLLIRHRASFIWAHRDLRSVTR